MQGYVEDIPSSLIAAFINEQEVRIKRLSLASLSVRTSKEIDIKKLKVAFYIFKENNYIELAIEKYEVRSIKKDKFWIMYELDVYNEEYADNVRRILKDYQNYINLRVFGCEGEFSADMVGYPADLDYDYYENHNNELEEWMSGIDDDAWNRAELEGVELAIQIDNYDRYHDFLHMNISEFKNYYFSSNYIRNKTLLHKELTRFYIGNEFCHNLFPDIELLIRMLDKCYETSLDITICTTYIMEHNITYYNEVVDRIYRWCIEKNYSVEIIINDYGMIELLSDKVDYISMSLGCLLNKRKRDPRYKYKRDIAMYPRLIKMATNTLDLSRELVAKIVSI